MSEVIPFHCEQWTIFNLSSIVLQVVVIAHVSASGMVDLNRHEKEKYFLTAQGKKESFPSLFDPYSLELSVVVPSYNEEQRCKLPETL